MAAFAKVLLFAIPSFFVLIVIEAIYAYWKRDFNFTSMDTISSLSAGMTNTLKNILGLSLIIISYPQLYEYLALTQIEENWLAYVLTFIVLDFGSYWYHRLAHHVNVFWNRHVIHHSGEEFNLPTAMRQSMSKFVSVAFIFLLPAALLGLPPKVIQIVTPLHLFLQFWYHTTHIGKLGWLEYIIVTPSQHRVHHAINPIYLDKNLSGIFCIWDRMFGTFQEELDEEPCVYGVTRQVKTWNPIKINFLHLILLIKDAWYTRNIWDKFRIWFMPTGWRPADVKERFPVISADPKNFEKYDTIPSFRLQVWSWIQFFVMLALLFHLMFNIAEIETWQVFVYGAFLFAVIYSYTTLMDKSSHALWMEIVKSVFALSIILATGDWFLLNQAIPFGATLMAIYQFVSIGVVAYFVMNEVENVELPFFTKKPSSI